MCFKKTHIQLKVKMAAQSNTSGASGSGERVDIDLGSEDSDDDTEEQPPPRVTKWFRPTNNRSLIWKHMKHDEKKTVIKCDLCPKIFKFKTGGTSTQRRHLKNVHHLSLVEEPTSKEKTKETQQLLIGQFMNRDECSQVSSFSYFKAG